MAMKTKCKKCGKKEVQLMSKMDIKVSSNFVNSTVFEKVLNMVDDWTSAKYFICGACGYKEDA